MNINRHIIFLLLACLVAGCNSSDDPALPYYVFVTGPTEVSPETTETYAIGDYANPETFIWSVEGPAEIVGTNQGDTVVIKFLSVGDVKLTVKNDNHFRVVPITVLEIKPKVKAILNGTGVLKSGVKDTVFLHFAAPLASDPSIKFLQSNDSSYFDKGSLAFSSGVMGPLVKIDAGNYYVTYTADVGNGTPEALITDIKSVEGYGALKIDSAYVQLYTVDNIEPLANITYSSNITNDKQEVTITVTFSEPVTFKSKLDSALRISFSGGGVNALVDTLDATSDPLVYTYTYTSKGSGNGVVDIELVNITDLGGNDLDAVTNGSLLTVDNTSPDVSGTADDVDTHVLLKITSTEKGIAKYLILDNGDDAPANVEEFLDTQGILSGIINVNAGSEAEVVKTLSTGSYNIYLISQDEVGNYSTISTIPLIMN